jgi:rod shape-determining protein MreB
MVPWFRQLFTHDLSLDMGEATTFVYSPHQGLIFHEPTPITLRQGYVGPIQAGKLIDLPLFQKRMQQVFQHIPFNTFLKRRPRVLVNVPLGFTLSDQKAIQKMVITLGARMCHIMPSILSAALGAGLPIHTSTGALVVDIGAGTSEIAHLAHNRILSARTLSVGGNAFTEAIQRYVRRTHRTILSFSVAEQLKQDMAPEMSVQGRQAEEGGQLQAITLSRHELMEAFEEPVYALSQILKTFSHIPSECVLTGGGALIQNLPQILTEKTGHWVRLAPDPQTCVVRGGSKALDRVEAYLV